MKFKLLLLSPIAPPVGGIASWTINILDFNECENGNWQIIHQNTAIKNQRITNKSIWKRLYSGLFNSLEIINEFKSNLKTYKPDVIHLTSSASFALIKDFFLIRIAKRNKIPIIIHFHFGRIPDLVKKNNLEWKLITKLIKNCNKTIVIDKKSFVSLIDVGFKNVINIPNPISFDLENYAKKEKLDIKKEETIKVLFVGHVVPQKGIFELVESCKLISEIKELIIIGPYEEDIKKSLIEKTVNKDKNWLKILGNQNQETVLNYMSKVTLLALPSYTEGFPNVIIEAMAMSCPIVATDVGAIPEMLGIDTKFECGICVQPKSIDALKIGLLKLINNKEKAKEFALNGNKTVLNEYTLNRINKMYEIVWQDALKNNIENY
jgi:glycosyltransferase involved in cell wall biosynthesis